MFKSLKGKISKEGQESEYYLCEDMARSYRDFGVPYDLAEEWVSAKLKVSEEVSKRACSHVYFRSSY